MLSRHFTHAMRILVLAGLIAGASTASAPAQSTTTSQQNTPFVVEYYYKARWGYADEFLRLFTKNHYPLLKREIALGRIVRVLVEKPRYHATEDGRWDYRVTIVWKNSQVGTEDFDTAPILKELFPDQNTFKQEEQRRFEILDAHWDLPVVPVDLDHP